MAALPERSADFTVRVVGTPEFTRDSYTCRAYQLVAAMEGCRVESIIAALTALMQDTRDVPQGDPARWLTDFADLESTQSGKAREPLIDIVHYGERVVSTASYRELLKAREMSGD